MMLRQLNNQHKGGEKASREFPKCHSKNNEKKGNSEKIQLDRKPFFWRKHLSLGTVYVLRGILEILKSRLKIGTSGDITTRLLNLRNLAFLKEIHIFSTCPIHNSIELNRKQHYVLP